MPSIAAAPRYWLVGEIDLRIEAASSSAGISIIANRRPAVFITAGVRVAPST